MSDGFISKEQFQAVYDHFREVIDNAEDEHKLNDLQNEFKLLLYYFRSVYGESERKTHKILHLMTQISKDKEKTNEVQKLRDEERKESAVRLWKTENHLDKLTRKEKLLIKQIEELKENLERSKNIEKNVSSQHGNFLKQQKCLMPNYKCCRNIDGENGEHTKAVHCDRQVCEFCSKRNSAAVNEVSSQEKCEKLISELNGRVNVLSTELKLSYKERDDLKRFIERNNKRLDDLKRQMERGREQGDSLPGDYLNKKSLKATIDKLVLDLYSKKCEIQTLQDGLEKEMEKRSIIYQENEEKDTILEDMKRKLNSIQKSKKCVSRKANILEEHLTIHQALLKSLQTKSDSLKERISDLKTRLKAHENRQKWLEAREITDDKKTCDHFESQVTIRDKRIRALTVKLSDARQQIESLRTQLRDKVEENAVMKSELFEMKVVTVSEQDESFEGLKLKLEAMENSNSQLQAEVKSMKRQKEVLMTKKNKLNCLKESNNKVEKQSKKRRFATKC